MRFIFVPFLLVNLFVLNAAGQDTLPSFSAIMKENGKVIISWRNNYRVINQISIQSSSDSLRNFTTLLTVPDPSIPENGFVDNKAQGSAMYYRLFILLGKSKYLFTKSRRAISETVANSQKPPAEEEDVALQRVDNQRIFYMQDIGNRQKLSISTPSKISASSGVKVERTIFIKRMDSIIGQLPSRMVMRFRDSILSKTKDTILFVHADTILIKSYVPPVVEVKEVYKVSNYVFTAKDGNVAISLPDATRKKYAVKFFEQDNTPLVEIKEIKDTSLILDKSNFVHAGWFRFELYEDGKLKEKNKLYIPKDF